MIPLIPAIAALAVQQGPALIRGIANMFGGSDTANQVADIVEQVSGIGLSADQQTATVAAQLGRITDPAALVELEKIRVALEKEQTRRQELALQDKQAEHHETQETVREGDNATDTYVRNTRPLLARQSWYATALYVLAFEGLKVASYGDGADWSMAAMLSTPAWAYLGLRTLDGFAPHPKSSGQKVQSAVAGTVSKLLTRR
jgi:hypothetical protein